MHDYICRPMNSANLAEVQDLLNQFLSHDPHYLASSTAYGDQGPQALAQALRLFIERPELGFVWLILCDGQVVGACVVCYAISTARGGLVVKLDDVTIARNWQGKGVGSMMINELKTYLREQSVSRIDCACHRENHDAWRFYQRLDFYPLHEERIACLLADK